MPTLERSPEPTTLSEAKRRLLAQRLKGAATVHDPDAIARRPAGVRAPIGPDQYAIWLESTLQPDVPTYNEIVTVRYRGEIVPTFLEQSFNSFLVRHEAWRTSYSLVDGEVLQIIHPEVRINPLRLIDLSHLPAAAADAESNRLATEQAVRFLDLQTPPLFRAILVRLGPNDCRLHLTISHLLFDGFSIRRTFLPELAATYAALLAGTSPNLPPVELHYADYTHWRQKQIESPAMQPHLDYWRNKLRGDLPVLRLPTDRARPAVISHRGAIERFDISLEVTEKLRHLGTLYGASFYMTLLASFKALLFRYSGQQDLIIGSVSDGRRRPELEAMMGYMIDVFPLRTSPTAATPFSDYLKQCRQTVLEAVAATELPLQRIIEALGFRRDLSHQPLFQTLFVIEPTPQPNGPWEIAATEITLGATKFDLYVEADEHPDKTAISIDYSTDLFDAPTIRRMIGHWQNILEGIVANPDTSLGDLPLLTPEECHLMLVRWNETSAPIPDLTLHGLVEAQVTATPNAPAVTFEGQTLTYDQLERQANTFAQFLQSAGAQTGTLAAVFLDRSHHLLAALFAILKTGAAYMPLDPGTPASRIALCLEDGAPSVILTQRSRLADLPATTARILVLEDMLGATGAGTFTPASVPPDSLAYVIHTSGSTGRPKGVELTHRGVVNFLSSMQREPGLTRADTLVAVTTISFDIAVLELFLPLICGAKVVIASREDAVDPARLAALLLASRATVLQATPATWSALVTANWAGAPALKGLCGGEALKRHLADRLLALGVDLWNVYGPTETTIWSTLAHITPGSASIHVGRPIANTTTYILDPQLQPVPIGVPGELYIGGAGVARGYRNQPELTATRFVSPAVADGQRLYRTGDYALYRQGGIIEIQGRADNQVKIRGYRIELEDVEVNLTAHPRVAAAAAKAWPDVDGGLFLCAYLTGVHGPPPTPSELRQFLRGRVADYMIPSHIVALDAMPLTSNGKIDRNQLPRPEPMAPGIALATPQDATLQDATLHGEELRLARIWSELLHVEEIAPMDNFFDLGGHSLLLLKVVRHIHKDFGVELPLNVLFQAPTLEKLAGVLRGLTANPSHSWTSLIPLNPGGTRTPLFLIHSLMLYGRLPSALGPDQPFYALQPLPFGDSASPRYVETMLDDHIRQIKRIQPHGPYQIAGWCFAGWLAYEIARRLEDAGDRVSLLALLDSWCPYRTKSRSQLSATDPGPRRGLIPRIRSFTFKVGFRLRLLAGLPSSERIPYVRRLLRDLVSSVSTPAERVVKGSLYSVFLNLRLPLPAFLRDSSVVTYVWLRKYQLKPYRGDITLIRPGHIAVSPDSDPFCGWRALTSGKISTNFVPGDRSTMFLGPNLATLAELLRTLMQA